MINYLKNLIRQFGLFLNFAHNVKFQKRFLHNQVAAIVNQFKQTNDGSLDEDDFRKIYLYGYAVPAMIGETFCVLRGTKMSEQERLAMTYLGTITGLFDDFFDKKNSSVAEIEMLIENPTESNSSNSYEKLIVTLFNKVLENCSDKNQLKSYCKSVFEAEVQSKKQMLPDIKRDEIKEIIFQKGGVSMLLYSCALSGSLSEADKTIIFKLGSLGQLENDIFDVYKDYHEGIKTLVTTETRISNLRKIYSGLVEEIFDMVAETNYPDKNKHDFMRILALVLCRGYVCLDYLEKNEQSTNNIFSVETYQKKDVVCDMETPGNFLRLLHYAAKIHY
jgi:hypothetical protein